MKYQKLQNIQVSEVYTRPILSDSPSGSVSDLADYHGMNTKHCLVIAFSKLLEERNQEVRDYTSFYWLPIRNQTRDFILQSRSGDMIEDAYSVFRVKSEDKEWKKILPQSVIDEVHKDLMGAELKMYLQ